MHGTLDTFSVVEVLQMLGRVRRSGTLHIECAERQIDVHFVQGRIAETRDSTRVYADTVLGSLLIKRSLVTEEQLDQCLREQESDPRPIGTILVERGYVAEDDLRDVLSRQVANTFLAVKTTGGAGTFMFVIDETAVPVDYLTIDTHSVLIEVSSVGVDYVAAFELFGAANTVLVRNRDYETLPRHSVPMARDEFHVLTLIDDRRTVGEVAAASHLEEVTVISILGKFCEAKVLLTAGDRLPSPPGEAALSDHRDRVWNEVARMGPGPERRPARRRSRCRPRRQQALELGPDGSGLDLAFERLRDEAAAPGSAPRPATRRPRARPTPRPTRRPTPRRPTHGAGRDRRRDPRGAGRSGRRRRGDSRGARRLVLVGHRRPRAGGVAQKRRSPACRRLGRQAGLRCLVAEPVAPCVRRSRRGRAPRRR